VLRRAHLLLLRAQDGMTPLHWAAYNGHASVVTLLCERGADKETKTEVCTRHAHAHAPAPQRMVAHIAQRAARRRRRRGGGGTRIRV
jgi:hypothetical protein